MTMATAMLLFATFLAFSSRVEAFGVSPLVVSKANSFVATSFVLSPSFVLSDESTVGSIPDVAIQASQAVVDTASAIPASGGGGVVDILRTIAVVITAVSFLGAGLALVTASIIVPAAAKELEQECKELSPELWDEYSARLQEGETMGNRPDLMQELGAKLQPLLDVKIERQFAEQKAKGIDVSKDEAAWRGLDSLNDRIPKPSSPASRPQTGVDMSAMSSQWDDDIDVVDAEVVKHEKK